MGGQGKGKGKGDWGGEEGKGGPATKALVFALFYVQQMDAKFPLVEVASKQSDWLKSTGDKRLNADLISRVVTQ